MKRIGLEAIAHLAVAIGLVAACGGQRSLGENTGGTTSVSTGGSDGATGGSDGATGGTTSASTGGTTSASTGGQTGTGDSGAPTDYISDPTLPIDPACTCASSDQICNAANQCVPRCDAAGRCATWLANHAVMDLLVVDTSLYFLVAASTDPLGNLNTDGSLYRVPTTGGTPTLIVGTLINPQKILGRYKNVTYATYTRPSGFDQVVGVSDSGAVTTLECEGAVMGGHWIAYPDTSSFKLMAIDLDGDLTPVLLDQPPTGGDSALHISTLTVLNDYVIYNFNAGRLDDIEAKCSIQLSNLAQGPICVSGSFVKGSMGVEESLGSNTTGDRFFLTDAPTHRTIETWAAPDTPLLTIYRSNADGLGDYWVDSDKAVYANGWFYLFLIDFQKTPRMVRVPTSVGRLPQDILPGALVARTSTYNDGNIALTGQPMAVSATTFFWSQSADSSSPYSSAGPIKTNQAQYIFSAPLPPQPCDTELPCADSTQVCTNGVCAAAQ